MSNPLELAIPLDRDAYERFDQVAQKLGTTPAALAEKLISEFMSIVKGPEGFDSAKN